MVNTDFDAFLDNAGIYKTFSIGEHPLDELLERLFDMIISLKMEVEELK